MVASGPSPLPSSLPTGRARVAAAAATLIVLAACVVQIVRADRACGRDFTYASDDAYVHLELAWRMATESAAPGRPSPVAAALAESASPAWTSLLAGVVRLARPGPAPGEAARWPWLPRLAPLILNLLMAGLLILLVGHALRFDVLRGAGMLLRLLVVAVCMPIPLLVLTGMEHLAHAFVLLLAVSTGIELIERERLAARRLLVSMAWMALAVSLRYESLAALGGLVLWAWIRRRLGRMVMTAAAGAGVALGLAIYLGTHGQSWLPEPVRAGLLNGADDWSAWGRLALARAIGNLREALVPAVLVMVCAALLWSRREQQSSPDAEDRIRVGWLFVFVAAGVMHLAVGRADESFRYVAYLVPLGMVALMRALANRPGAKWAPSAPVGLRYSVMAVFCLLPLAVAAVPVARAGWHVPEDSRQVFLLNRKLAAFIRVSFPNATVVSSDVGVLRFETNAHVLKLAGIVGPAYREQLSRADLLFLFRPPDVPYEDPSSFGFDLIGLWNNSLDHSDRAWWQGEVYARQSMTRDAIIAMRELMRELPQDLTTMLGWEKEAMEDVGGQTRPSSEHGDSAKNVAVR